MRIFNTLFFMMFSTAALAQPPSFQDWLTGFKQQAITAGIKPQTVQQAFAQTQKIEDIIRLDRNQPETKLTFDQYRQRVVTPQRLQQAKAKLRENRALLARVAADYKVQPRFIVALWAIETNFGQLTGGFPIIDALATLSYDGRRATYFQGELLNALRILEQGHIEQSRFIGSWAGAMGQCQFMPTSFLKFAIDYNKDGKKDIWQNREDIFASIANYLAEYGWNDQQTWGRQVSLPEKFDASLISLDISRDLAEWQKLGVRTAAGAALPVAGLKGSLVQPDAGGTVFLVYDNYRTLLQWNRSNLFALAVGALADGMAQ